MRFDGFCRDGIEMEVDYLKLSEQYAGFLVAIGGISITVLALLLSFAQPSSLLVAALLVAPISCFAGALMMAETAGFISHSKGKPSGERLFLLASINIYVAVVLLVFALTLLPRSAADKVDLIAIRLIPGFVFVGVIIAVLCWMVLSAIYRMPAPKAKWWPVIGSVALSVGWGSFLYLTRFKGYRLQISFVPILAFTVVSLVWFTWTFKNGGKVRNSDIWLFSLAITSTCASLGVASIWS
jgi:hypothetical protein